MEKGLIHIYAGDGKGKTTAAIGLSVRAAGCGKKVLFAQFLKGSETGELTALTLIHNIKIIRNSENYGFFHTLSAQDKAVVTDENNSNLYYAIEMAQNNLVDVIALDEVLDAIAMGAIDTAAFTKFVLTKPETVELVLTGRKPSAEIAQIADYYTEMVKNKHPYDKGIPARKGIEY